jgi:hypothetical protein
MGQLHIEDIFQLSIVGVEVDRILPVTAPVAGNRALGNRLAVIREFALKDRHSLIECHFGGFRFAIGGR